MNYVKTIDTELLIGIQKGLVAIPGIDVVMILLSSHGIGIIVAIFLFLLLLTTRQWTWFYIFLASLLTIVLCDSSTAYILKPFFSRLRPCHDNTLKEMIRLVAAHCGGLYSFPSNHASNAAAVAMVIFMLNQYKLLSYLFMGLALCIGVSRVYLGVHYPSDVLAGFIWGASIGYGVSQLVLKLSTKIQKIPWLARYLR